MFVKLIKRMTRVTHKDLAIAGVFALAVVAAAGFGLAARGTGSAAASRDCDTNSIDYKPNNGGCGAANGTELIADIQNNDPSDLQTFYDHFGLNSTNYAQFASTAQEGTINRDGTVKTADGTVVMTAAETYGRKSWGNPNRKPQTIGNVTYYHAAPSTSFANGVQSIPAMIMFNDQGEAQVVIMNPCGNGVSGTSVKNGATCKSLNKTQPDAAHKPNLYSFTANADVIGNAKISRVVYHFSDDNSTVTKGSLTDAVEHTFTKDGTVSVVVYASVPGGHEIEAAASVNCQTTIKYVPPFYVCSNLLATAIDQAKKNFRFTVIAKTDSTGQTTLENVDFTLDGKTTTTGVTAKDDNGNIYKEYSFTDEVQHVVKASLNFNTAQGVKSVTCEAPVTPAKTPKCTVPGHENEAPDSPNCAYCQPGIPKGDARCTPPQTPPTTLVNTGAGDVFGIFGGTVIAAFFAHRFFLNRKSRRASVTVDS